jgi:adenylate cyclase
VGGTFRRASDQISVTIRLIGAPSGEEVWAETYDRFIDQTNSLVVQKDLSQRIGAALGDTWTGVIAKAELRRAKAKPVSELTSYECVLNANDAINAVRKSPEMFRRARSCLEATVKSDPTYADAWANLVRILCVQRYYGVGLNPPEADDIDKRAYLIPNIIDAGNRAVELAADSASAHLALFQAYYVTCQSKRMRIEADRVITLNSNDARALGVMGNYLAFAGEWEYGRQLAERALELAGPAAPRWWWWATAKDHYRKGEYAEAYEAFQHSYTEPNWLDHLHIIYTLPYIGRLAEAKAQVPDLLKLRPDMTIREADRFYKMFCFDEEYRQRMDSALRLAGLPE